MKVGDTVEVSMKGTIVKIEKDIFSGEIEFTVKENRGRRMDIATVTEDRLFPLPTPEELGVKNAE